MVQADVSVGEISWQQKFFDSFFNFTLGIIMAGNNATSEVGCFYDFEDLKNVSEMVAEVSEASKDQQRESATSENCRFANLSERD